MLIVIKYLKYKYINYIYIYIKGGGREEGREKNIYYYKINNVN